MTLWLYVLQRGSALVLAPLVVAHLVLIVIASRDGDQIGTTTPQLPGYTPPNSFPLAMNWRYDFHEFRGYLGKGD